MMKPGIEWAWTKKYPNMDIQISDYIVPAMSKESSCPFHKMGAFLSKMKNPFDDVAHWHHKIFAGEEEYGVATTTPTFRTCWGAQELFKDSLVMRSPTDLVVSYDRNRHILYRGSIANNTNPDDFHGFDVHQHPIWQTQMDDGTNILDNKIALKFLPPFKLKTHSKVMFLTPTFHKDTPWRILPGLLPAGVIQPNIFLELDLPEEGDVFHLQIKRGEPLAYMYFLGSHNLHKFKENKEGLTEIMRTRFLRGIVK